MKTIYLKTSCQDSSGREPIKQFTINMEVPIPLAGGGTLFKMNPDSGFASGLELFSFTAVEAVQEDVVKVAAWLYLPHFFDQLSGIGPMRDVGGVKEDWGIHALFLLDEPALGPDFACPLAGSNGCPWYIHTGDIARFTFNHQSYYPFLMTDFSTGYFVCDQNSKFEQPWIENHAAWVANDPRKRHAVGITEPVCYDAGLGIYKTRIATPEDVIEFLLPGNAGLKELKAAKPKSKGER